MTPTSDPQEPVTAAGRALLNWLHPTIGSLSLRERIVAIEAEARAAALAERVLLPGSLEAIRIRDAAFPDRTMRLIEEGDDGMLEAMADRRRLLAHVDALAAASPDSAPNDRGDPMSHEDEFDATLDGTDGAHPAWWRGDDHGYQRGVQEVEALRARLALLESDLRWLLRHNGGECPADHPARYAEVMEHLLASPDSAPAGLDVERLARGLTAMTIQRFADGSLSWGDWTTADRFARAIADAYERATPASTTGPAHGAGK